MESVVSVNVGHGRPAKPTEHRQPAEGSPQQVRFLHASRPVHCRVALRWLNMLACLPACLLPRLAGSQVAAVAWPEGAC